MPNGGSDCCGTCWFNAKNKGEAGYGQMDSTAPNHCVIRDVQILNPYYTYCGNHPHRCPEKDPISIGPIFVPAADGGRAIWQPSPDTEEIRLHLLALLAAIPETPPSEYPMGLSSEELIVWQMGEFAEVRAEKELRRIAAFNPKRRSKDAFQRSRQQLVFLAQAALVKIAEAKTRNS
jgi:hypothetical protein